jgi:adenylate cyclase
VRIHAPIVLEPGGPAGRILPVGALLIVVVAVEGAALVAVVALWRGAVRRAEALRQQVEQQGGGKRWRLPSGRETVKAVIETASLVRQRGVAGALRTSIEDLAGWAQVERPDLARLAARDGTVSILFSDIEGSTALNERLGDRAWVKVLAQHDRIVRRHCDVEGGHIVKSQGDGFMIVFAEPLEAIRFSIETQRALAADRQRGDDRAISVRVGIHKGDAVHRDGDLFGRNVALAARVAAQAGGSEILVSDAVREAVEDETVAFDDGRDVELKGLSGRHRVYAIDWAERSTDDA